MSWLMQCAKRLQHGNTAESGQFHFSFFSLIYFDLSYQTEKPTRDPKQLIFRYRLSADAAANFNVHAVVLYEEEVKIDKIGNELVIV